MCGFINQNSEMLCEDQKSMKFTKEEIKEVVENVIGEIVKDIGPTDQTAPDFKSTKSTKPKPMQTPQQQQMKSKNKIVKYMKDNLRELFGKTGTETGVAFQQAQKLIEQGQYSRALLHLKRHLFHLKRHHRDEEVPSGEMSPPSADVIAYFQRVANPVINWLDQFVDRQEQSQFAKAFSEDKDDYEKLYMYYDGKWNRVWHFPDNDVVTIDYLDQLIDVENTGEFVVVLPDGTKKKVEV